MALIVTQKLYIDIDKGIAYQRWNDFSLVPTPVLYAGDTAKLELYLVRATRNGSFPMESVAFPASAITVAVGTPGGTPAASGTTWSSISAPTATFSAPILTVPTSAVSGYFILELTYSTSTYNTLSIPLGAPASDIEAAIESTMNAVSGWSAADATVSQTGDGKYSIMAFATNGGSVRSLDVDVASYLTGVSGYDGALAMTGSGVTTLLGSATEVTSTLEVQCNTGSGYQTYLQIPCTVRAQVTNP